MWFRGYGAAGLSAWPCILGCVHCLLRMGASMPPPTPRLPLGRNVSCSVQTKHWIFGCCERCVPQRSP